MADRPYCSSAESTTGSTSSKRSRRYHSTLRWPGSWEGLAAGRDSGVADRILGWYHGHLRDSRRGLELEARVWRRRFKPGL